MRARIALIDDLSRRPDVRPQTVAPVPFRYPGWIWLSFIVFGIVIWTGAGIAIHTLIAVL
jgi:hypothetical protein